NLDNIFGIISDYLEWSLSQNITTKKEKRYIHYLRNFENASISLERYKLAKTLIDSTIIK
ncbi:MAG: hypothetical protein IJN85_00425, partial [Oscillospiraceae bacterium]|nr:hypothetical protein [Oscillospiraceae bacterium]